ncbi:MAG: uracil phosphoribosyltransferase [Elusimicrobia bacterium CG08_land_8_20_14_0_20_51_18]|nr:MAG: uracil phosphoribosyltransferase [Elusimicrobia bacterium CG08_land_8_20_14_0_20_51_18]
MSVTISKHPLVLDKISRIRDLNTPNHEFRRLMSEVAMLLGYEVTANLPLKDSKVRTPLAVAKTKKISKEVVFVGILRAGLGLMDGLMKIFPEARLAHIGIYRDEETLKPVKYYIRFPEDLKDKIIILADPMLATGGSAVEALNLIKSRGAKEIHFVCLIAARSGIEYLKKYHKDVNVYAGCVDEKLNENGYIVPGLGDAGDRMFGTN